jgi:hypothetical protein
MKCGQQKAMKIRKVRMDWVPSLCAIAWRYFPPSLLLEKPTKRVCICKSNCRNILLHLGDALKEPAAPTITVTTSDDVDQMITMSGSA